jgi:hypothetical protein
MSERRHFIIIASVGAAFGLAYLVGWHTWVGLALRRTSRLYVRNNSDTPLRNIRIPIANSIQPAVTSRFDIIAPFQRVRVSVPRSHIYLWEVAFEQGARTIVASNLMLKVRMGGTLELVVDSNGNISPEYDY